MQNNNGAQDIAKNVKERLAEWNRRGCELTYNKGIERDTLVFMSSGYAEYLQARNEIYSDISAVMNGAEVSGVTSKVKKCISELTDCIVTLGSEGAQSAQVQATRKNWTKTVKESEGKTGMIKKEVIKCVNSVRQACEKLAQVYPGKATFVANLSRCNELASEIIITIDGACDNSSKMAAAIGKDIMQAIYSWRYNASQQVCSSNDVRALEQVLEAAKKWAQLKVPTRTLFSNNIAKEKDIAKFQEMGAIEGDLIHYIVTCDAAFEKLAMLKEAVADFNATTEMRYNKDKILAKLNENQQAIDAVDKEIKQIEFDYDNGVIDAMKASSRIQQLENEKNRLVTERMGGTVTMGNGKVRKIRGLQDEMGDVENQRLTRDSLSKKLNEPIDSLESYTYSAGIFSKLMSKVQVAEIAGLLRGNLGNPADIEVALNTLNAGIIHGINEVKSFVSIYDTVNNNIEDIHSILDQTNIDIGNVNTNQAPVYVPNGVNVEQPALNEDAAAAFMANRAKKRQEVEERQANTVKAEKLDLFDIGDGDK